MHEPFNTRPADYSYCLRSDTAYGWSAGITADGLQVLHCKRNWLVFNEAGDLIQAGSEELPFHDRPIAVHRFWLPELWMGIEDLDSELALFYTNPDEFLMESEDVTAWLDSGQFVFHCGWSEYVLGPQGQVETS